MTHLCVLHTGYADLISVSILGVSGRAFLFCNLLITPESISIATVWAASNIGQFTQLLSPSYQLVSVSYIAEKHVIIRLNPNFQNIIKMVQISTICMAKKIQFINTVRKLKFTCTTKKSKMLQ